MAVRTPTIASYFAAFQPDPDWDDLISWPADVFALTNLVLDHTEAYRFAVSPPPGRQWPPRPGWQEDVVAAACEWRDFTIRRSAQLPPFLRQAWEVVRRTLHATLESIRHADDPELCEALLTLHAISDEAFHDVTAIRCNGPGGPFEQRVRDLLQERGSLARIEPARVRIVPKTQLAARGLTIRSFSRYLALSYESIDLQWRTIDLAPGSSVDRRHFNLLLLPWPLTLSADAFRPVEGPLQMDSDTFGFFAYEPHERLDLDLVSSLIAAASRKVRRIDSVLLPEASVHEDEVAGLEHVLSHWNVPTLIAGVRAPGRNGLARNYVHLGFGTATGWQHYQQDKHHRWCLDGPQIRQYHLSHVLSPTRQWWEAIALPARTVQVIDVGGGATTAPLICEDLARLDEVADVLRRIGPSFVIALLLDGPQLEGRWARRYASVLADDPGSAVLTLSSLGMVKRSSGPSYSPTRTIAMWSDPVNGYQPLELARGASGMLISTTVAPKTVWTADSRRHEASTPSSVLSEVHQLRARNPGCPGPAPVTAGHEPEDARPAR